MGQAFTATFTSLASVIASGVLGCSGHGSAPDAGRSDAARHDARVMGDAAGDAKGDAPDSGRHRSDGGLVSDASIRDADAGSTDAPAEAATPDGCAPGPRGEPQDLRCTGLYSDWSTKTVSADVHVYDPGLHLWSDNAQKTRWISLPPGKPIDTSNMDEWTFPAGTKIWKQFVLLGKPIETRLLWKMTAASWYLTTYRWSSDLTSAPELVTGEADADGQGYEVPGQSKCHSCHDGRLDEVLGFEAVALSSPAATLAPSSAPPAAVTLAGLASAGWITSAPDASLAVPGGPTAAAALGYLHINCGTACHNRFAGSAESTGFYMRLDVATLGSVSATDTVTTGVGQVSGFMVPDAGTSYLLDPHNVGRSAVHYRISVRDGVDGAGNNAQMPPIDTHRVDDAGVATVAAWIEAGCGD